MDRSEGRHFGSESASRDQSDANSNAARFHKTTQTAKEVFSLLEMLLATVILLVGLVAIAQLVPASILMNFPESYGFFGARFRAAGVGSNARPAADRESPSPMRREIRASLADPAVTNSVQGTNVLVFSNQAAIDFTSSVSGYNFTFKDEADPRGTTYDVRWL